MQSMHAESTPDRTAAQTPPTAQRSAQPAAPTQGFFPRGSVVSPVGLLTLQRQAGNRATGRILQRFAGTEHVALGDTASKEKTGIRYTEDPKDELTFGEMVAMAGDYFGSRDEMVSLSSHPFGREQLAYARARVTASTPPAVSAGAKKAADDRYYKLAMSNKSHFAGGGTARGDYESGHLQALVEAYKSGQQGLNAYFTDALQLEAFSAHHLTDSFSGGHIRTPRTALIDYYAQNFGNSVTLMKEFLRNYLVRRLNALNPTELKNMPDAAISSMVDGMLEDMAGSALESFSLGDLVSLAMHDFDNVQGVPVVSACDQDEQLVPGGFHWVAMGDNQIGSGGGAGNAATTFAMASAAVKVSRTELDVAYLLGAKDYGKAFHPFQLEAAAVAATNTLAPFRALKFIPHEDTDLTRPDPKSDMSDGPLGDWRWGKFSPKMRAAFESSVVGEVVPKVMSAATGVPDPKIVDLWVTKYTINARQAVIDLGNHLKTAPLTTFEALFGPAS